MSVLRLDALRRSRWLWLAVAAAVFFAAACAGLYHLVRHFSTMTAFKRLGAVQILGNDDELWMFMEIDLVVLSPNPLASPRAFKLEHEQYVAVRDQDGWRQVRPVHPHSGGARPLSFNKNITHIFRHNDTFYAADRGNVRRAQSLYRWTGDRFIEMPSADQARVREQTGLDQTIHPAQYADRADAITEEAGWHVVYESNKPILVWDVDLNQDPHTSSFTFRWRQDKYAIFRSAAELPLRLYVVRLAEDGRIAEPKQLLVEFDATDRPMDKSTFQRRWRMKVQSYK